MSGGKRTFYFSINFSIGEITRNERLKKWETVIRCTRCGTSQTIRNINKGAIDDKAKSWRDSHICPQTIEAEAIEAASAD